MNRRRSDKSNQQESKQRRHASKVVRRTNIHLVIDGYNLMHVTRFKPTNSTGDLQRCREGLLSLLADHLSPQQCASITVVFDSENAPQHLPDRSRWKHIEAVFARDENSADDLIVKMIRSSSDRKSLVVVSSDHRVHVAAGKKVAVVDSDLWFEALLDRAREPEEEETDDAKPEEGIENPFPDGYFDDLDSEE